MKRVDNIRRLFVAGWLAVSLFAVGVQAQNIFDPAQTLVGGATVSGNLIPTATNAYDVGAAGATFRNIFAGSTIVGPGIGPSTVQQHTLPAVASDTVALLNANQTLTNKTLGSGVSAIQGTGSGTVTFVGVVATVTAPSTTTGTSKQTLATYSLPQNSLSANGKGVRITAWGTTAANANNKTLGIDFGATTVASLTSAVNNGVLRVEATVLRSAAAQEEAVGQGRDSASGTSLTRTAPAENNTTGPTVINIFGTTPTIAADITLTGALVEAIN